MMSIALSTPQAALAQRVHEGAVQLSNATTCPDGHGLTHDQQGSAHLPKHAHGEVQVEWRPVSHL
jgi:hypothetical protein